MKVALVHDYLNEYGGAERVLEALSRIWPDAPIYTAFAVPGSSGQKAFEGKRVITSWFQKVPGYHKLYSPLRFLIPRIWDRWDFSDYDLVVSSASWYVTKGMKRGPKTREICYCHTPPRWLYGYETSVNWQRWWPVRVYGLLVGHFLRMYDWDQAQKVDVFAANSKNVANRIRKFYRREAEVIYPPVSVKSVRAKPGNYYLMVTRIVGGKGIEMAIEAVKKAGFRLVVAGEKAGWARVNNGSKMENIEFLGRVSEEEKYSLMSGARGFLALARDEDFGITPVESICCGTPVVAFNGGGYRESVADGKSGVLFDDYSPEGLIAAIGRLEQIKWDRTKIKTEGKKFSEDRFFRKMKKLAGRVVQ